VSELVRNKNGNFTLHYLTSEVSSPVARHWGHNKGRHSVVTQCEADSLGSSVEWPLNLCLCPLLCCVTSHNYGSHNYSEEMTGSGVFSWHTTTQTHRVSTSTRWHSALCCHSNETHAPIANSPNNAQLEGTPYHSPKLHPGPCSSVGMRRGTDTYTHKWPWPIYISCRLWLHEM